MSPKRPNLYITITQDGIVIINGNDVSSPHVQTMLNELWDTAVQQSVTVHLHIVAPDRKAIRSLLLHSSEITK